LIYSVASLGSATAQDEWQLLFWRCLLGLGMGGEWATGATLVAETWPPGRRNKALALMQSGWALGFIASALVSQQILPQWGWRALFAVGALPALCTFWIRSRIDEPDEWKVHHARTALDQPHHDLQFFDSLGAQIAALFDMRWRRTLPDRNPHGVLRHVRGLGIFTWLPSFLATPVDKGGAGLSFLKSINWTIALQTGAFVGYVSFGWVADWNGPASRAYATCVILAAVLAPVYVHLAKSGANLMVIGPLIGLVGRRGVSSGLSPMLSATFSGAKIAGGRTTYGRSQVQRGRGISACARLADWIRWRGGSGLPCR
jgi:MFS family permease